MNGTAWGRRRFLIAGSRAAALLVGVPVWHAAVASDRRGVVALAYDARRETLLKADAQAAYRSDDGGRRWTTLDLPAAPAPRGLTSIAVSAGARPALYVAGTSIGVLRSDDGGRRWSARSKGLPSNGVAALATHAERPRTVYAYVADHGILRSENAGQRWRLMDAGPRGGITRFVHSNLAGSMQSGWLFAAAPNGVLRAMDCFCGWRDAGELKQPVHAVAYDPRQPRHVYAAADATLFFSGDGGETWSQRDAPVSIEALVVTARGELYAAGADGNLYRRSASATNWERLDA